MASSSPSHKRARLDNSAATDNTTDAAPQQVLQGKLLLENIVSFLGVVSRVRATSVSHAFHQACSSDVAWVGSRWTVDSESLSHSHSFRAHSKFTQIQHLSFLPADNDFFAGLPPLPSLLSVRYVPRMTPEDAQKFPRLEQLTVRCETLNLDLLTTCSQMPHLQSLQLMQVAQLELTLDELEVALDRFPARVQLYMHFQEEIYEQFPDYDYAPVHLMHFFKVLHRLHSVDIHVQYEPLEMIINSHPDWLKPPDNSKLHSLKLSTDAITGYHELSYREGVKHLVAYYPSLRHLDLTRQEFDEEDDDEEEVGDEGEEDDAEAEEEEGDEVEGGVEDEQTDELETYCSTHNITLKLLR